MASLPVCMIIPSGVDVNAQMGSIGPVVNEISPLIQTLKAGINRNMSLTSYSDVPSALNGTSRGDCYILVMPLCLFKLADYPDLRGIVISAEKAMILSTIHRKYDMDQFKVSRIFSSYPLDMWIFIAISLYLFWVIFVVIQRLTKRPMRPMETLKEVLCHFINQESDACEGFMEKKLSLILTMFSFFIMIDLLNRLNTNLASTPNPSYAKGYQYMNEHNITAVFLKMFPDHEEFERSIDGSIKRKILEKSQSVIHDLKTMTRMIQPFLDIKVTFIINSIFAYFAQNAICTMYVSGILGGGDGSKQDGGVWVISVNDPLSVEDLNVIAFNRQFGETEAANRFEKRLKNFFEAGVLLPVLHRVSLKVNEMIRSGKQMTQKKREDFEGCISNDVNFGTQAGEVSSWKPGNFRELWISMGIFYFISGIVLLIELIVMMIQKDYVIYL